MIFVRLFLRLHRLPFSKYTVEMIHFVYHFYLVSSPWTLYLFKLIYLEQILILVKKGKWYWDIGRAIVVPVAWYELFPVENSVTLHIWIDQSGHVEALYTDIWQSANSKRGNKLLFGQGAILSRSSLSKHFLIKLNLFTFDAPSLEAKVLAAFKVGLKSIFMDDW